MKETVTVLIFLSSIFSMHAQDLASILKSINNGQRADTIISFDKEHELGYMPLTIIKGKNSGKVFTIVSGVHGYEYPPIIAVQEMMKEIDANRLRGTLIILLPLLIQWMVKI